MIRISGLEKLSKEEYEKIDLGTIEAILELSRDFEELKELGENVNISGICKESTQFDLDNGQLLLRFNIARIDDNFVIYITNGRDIHAYKININTRKPAGDKRYSNAKNIVLEETKNQYSYEYYIFDRGSDMELRIYIASENFDKNVILDYLIQDNYTVEGLANILPKDDMYILYTDGKYERRINYYNDNLVEDIRSECNGKEGQQEENKL